MADEDGVNFNEKFISGHAITKKAKYYPSNYVREVSPEDHGKCHIVDELMNTRRRRRTTTNE